MPPCPPLVSSKGRWNNQPVYMTFQGNRVGEKFMKYAQIKKN